MITHNQLLSLAGCLVPEYICLNAPFPLHSCPATDDAASAASPIGSTPGAARDGTLAGVYFQGWAEKSPTRELWGDKKRVSVSPCRGNMGSASGTGVLLLVVMVVVGVFPPGVQSMRPSEHFLYQSKIKCHFPNGTTTGPGVYFLESDVWGRQEVLRYDSRRGTYEAVTELSEATARAWNNDKAFLEQRRAEVDSFCRHNYGMDVPFVSARKLKPQLQITPTDSDPSSHHTLLVCNADSFFPAKIGITWLRNGKEEDESRVVSTELIRNGDWTFSIQVMLEAQPERGDVYACRVEHASLPGPTSIQWEPQSDSARSKMWTGVVGLLLGLVFVGPGLALYLKNKKGTAIPPPAALLS